MYFRVNKIEESIRNYHFNAIFLYGDGIFASL